MTAASLLDSAPWTWSRLRPTGPAGKDTPASSAYWACKYSGASKYLLSLGLSSSHVARVPHGPALWLVVQPLIGALADSSASCLGRRRLYMPGGCLVSVAGMLLLGYTRVVPATATAWASSSNDRLTVTLAVLSIFFIDLAANAVHHALPVDTLPPSAQAAGNACAALMLGTGSIVGFFRDAPLPTLLPFLHVTSSLEALASLVSLLLIGCHLITALLVRERVLLGGSAKNNPSLINTLRGIWSNARTLPGVIRRIVSFAIPFPSHSFPLLSITTFSLTPPYHHFPFPFHPSPSLSPASILSCFARWSYSTRRTGVFLAWALGTPPCRTRVCCRESPMRVSLLGIRAEPLLLTTYPVHAK
ncbi:hypothetical protein C8J57DRAFT_1722527 [Mycena rebaudengoi]|nr:hypothetical protein C8J57DRAFT_1722527 [Mycena rebaudengoi]